MKFFRHSQGASRPPRARHITRLGVAALLAGATSIGFGQVSYADEMTPTINATGHSLERVSVNSPQGTRLVHTGYFRDSSTGVSGYCVEPNTPGSRRSSYTATDAASFVPAGANATTWKRNQARISWVLQNSYPGVSSSQVLQAAGATGGSERDVVSATQLAVWALSGSGVTPSSGNVSSSGSITDLFRLGGSSATINRVYAYLLKGAASIPDSTPGSGGTAVKPVFNKQTISATAGDLKVINSTTYVGPITVTSSVQGSSASVSVKGPNLPAGYSFVALDQSNAEITLTTLPVNSPFYLKVPNGAQAGHLTITATAGTSSTTTTTTQYKRLVVWVRPGGGGGQPWVSLHPNGGYAQTYTQQQATATATIAWGSVSTPQQPQQPQPQPQPQPGGGTPVGDTLKLLTTAEGTLSTGRSGSVTDRVQYQGLTTTTWYVLKGQLMDKCSNKPLTGLTTSQPFLPGSGGRGVAIMKLPISKSEMRKLTQSSSCTPGVVAFEYLYKALHQSGKNSQTGSDPVASHADINDAAQTVPVTEAPATPQTPDKPTLPHTGASMQTMSFLVMGSLLMALGLVGLVLGRRQRQVGVLEF